MLFTVSTVKETVPGLERLVARNLASGVDHLLVFVDDADPDALAWLAASEHATGIATDEHWWGGHRPEQLNARQKVNANLARTALVGVPEATWLFHIDGDEVLVADRAALAAVPAGVGVLHAPPFEAVSQTQWPADRVTSFKRLLDEGELELLVLLGAVPRPRNEAYFHGHVKGKSGMRPALDRWFSLHEVTDDSAVDVPPGAGGAVRLLHYESWSYEEFVRKWTNILGAGTLPALRGNRQSTARAIAQVLGQDLAPDARERLLRRIYQRTTEDDLALLQDLGVLVTIDPDDSAREPDPLPVASLARLAAALDALGTVRDKRPFRAAETADGVGAALREASEALRGGGLGRADQDDVLDRWGTAPRGLRGRLRRTAPGR